MKLLNVYFLLIMQILSFEVKKDQISSLNLKIGNKLKVAEKGLLKELNIIEKNSLNNSTLKIGKNINIPSYSVFSVKTDINVRKGSCDAEVKEEVNFLISNGVFSSLTRKISLEGTSETMYGFKLTSSDVKLKDAKLIKNCYDENQVPEHEYACVIAVFDEITAFNKSRHIQIEYEYYAEGFVKSSSKPFTENEIENGMVWIYDNRKNIRSIEYVTLKLNFEDEIKFSHFHSFPEKVYVNGKSIIEAQNETNISSLHWNKKEVFSDSYQSYNVHLPQFNDKCPKLVHHQIDFKLGNVVQFFFVFVVIIMFVFLVAYIYINEKEKHESLKLNEEIQSFKKLKKFYDELNREVSK